VTLSLRKTLNVLYSECERCTASVRRFASPPGLDRLLREACGEKEVLNLYNTEVPL